MSSDYTKALKPIDMVESSIVKHWEIPIYQRLFVWQEEQIQQLLDDLKKAQKGQEDYYIGIFTIVTNGEEKWIVVDGQQRLTFLSLFAAWCIRVGVLENEWRKFLLLDNCENDFRINYFGREEEKADLQIILTKAPIASLANQNFRTFCDCMGKMQNNFMQTTSGETGSFENYARFVFEHTAFLISLLPENYNETDLNRFFEKMNSAGRQLSAIDQIRGRYFPSSARLFDACLNFQKRFPNDKIQEEANSDEIFDLIHYLDTGKIEQSQVGNNAPFEEPNARSILSHETMLLHVLYLTTEKTVNRDTHHILNTFKDVFAPLSQNRKHDYLENLKNYRVWLDEHVIYLDSEDEKSVEYKLRNSSELEDEPHNASLSLTALKQFQSMLYVSSDGWQSWVLDYYSAKKNNTNLNADDELAFLKQRERESRLLPSLEQMCYKQIDRYWFWLLDYLLWEICNNKKWDELNFYIADKETDIIKAIRGYKFKRNRSIEHLHPQNPLQESPEWQNDRNNNKDKIRDGFGNLAMISASFNSTQSNDSIGVKFARVKDSQIPSCKLESIKMLMMFLDAKKEDKNWIPKIAEEHGNKMYILLSNFMQRHC